MKRRPQRVMHLQEILVRARLAELVDAAREATDVHYECRCVGCERLRALIKQIEP